MKIQSNHLQGFTVIEVSVVLLVIAFLACFLIPSLIRAKARAQRISCTSNLKIAGLASRLWANDHADQFPFASTNANSSLAWVNSPQVFRHYQVMSNELVTPKTLACPADRQRSKTSDFTQLSNSNLSYFVGLDAREDVPNSILSGDRNLAGGTLSNGFLRALSPNTAAEWTRKIHGSEGNIGLGDGSVQQVTTVGLRRQLTLQTNAFIRLAVP